MSNSNHWPLRKPLRLAGFDYASSGMYFITVCSQHMEHRFGTVEHGQVRLNEAGAMVASFWQANAERYPAVALDTFVLMPNHLHAIVFLGANPNAPNSGVTLSRLVQSFKSYTTTDYARGVRAGRYPPFERVLWQRSFYDKILRNERALSAARSYIEANPARWSERSHVRSPEAQGASV